MDGGINKSHDFDVHGKIFSRSMAVYDISDSMFFADEGILNLSITYPDYFPPEWPKRYISLQFYSTIPRCSAILLVYVHGKMTD